MDDPASSVFSSAEFTIFHDRLERFMHYSCESAERISEQYYIVTLNDQTILNESSLKTIDAI